MVHELSNSTLGGAAAGAGIIAGVFVGGWSAAITGAAVAKHNAATTAVARATEAKPRSKPSYIIGLSSLVIPGADAPLRCQGTRAMRPSSQPLDCRAQMAIGWGGLTTDDSVVGCTSN